MKLYQISANASTAEPLMWASEVKNAAYVLTYQIPKQYIDKPVSIVCI